MIMTPLELALVILVAVWTVLFIVFGVLGFRLLKDIHVVLERVRDILDTTRAVTEDVRAPFQAAAAGVKEIFSTTRAPSATLDDRTSAAALPGEPPLEPVP